MGIPKLYLALEPYVISKHLLHFEGRTFGIDGFCFLHQAALSCSRQLCTKVPTRRFVKSFMDRIHLYGRFKIRVIVVFDGSKLPTKSIENANRERDRKANLRAGHFFDKMGDFDLGSKAYRNAFSKSEIVSQVIEALRVEGIEYVVSPFEGDAQLGFLMAQRKIDVAVSDDTDLLPYGCSRVIFSTDRDGFVLYFERSFLNDYKGACDRDKARNKIKRFIKEETKDPLRDRNKSKVCLKEKDPLNLSGLTLDQLILFCVLKGCDYNNGVGLDDASLVQLVSNRDYTQTMKALKAKQSDKAEDFERPIYAAYMTYKHHLVYNQDAKKVIHLTKPPEDVDLSFLGCVLPDAIATGIAEGNLSPSSHEPYEAPQELDYLKEMDHGIIVHNRELANTWKMSIENGDIEHAIHTIKDFDSFIRCYSSSCLMTLMKDKEEYHFFRDDYTVSDADGRWTQRLRLPDAQRSWQLNCLTIIEGKLPYKELILGTKISMEGKWAEMSLWTKYDSTDEKQLAIAKEWKRCTLHEIVIGYALRLSHNGDDQTEKPIPNEKQYILII